MITPAKERALAKEAAQKEKLLAAMPGTVNELTEKSGVPRATVVRLLAKLKGQVYCSAWLEIKHHKGAAIYSKGSAPNFEKPLGEDQRYRKPSYFANKGSIFQ